MNIILLSINEIKIYLLQQHYILMIFLIGKIRLNSSLISNYCKTVCELNMSITENKILRLMLKNNKDYIIISIFLLHCWTIES